MVKTHHNETSISFILNDREVHTHERPSLCVLDWLRNHANLKGSKEGCKEGDCGACTVLIGTLKKTQSGDAAIVQYHPVTSCLTPMAALEGKHLVTIEGLSSKDGQLNPLQQSFVDEGASQCGFCTPGFIVAATAGLLETASSADAGVDITKASSLQRILSGNLCRCTGYHSIQRACSKVFADFIEAQKESSQKPSLTPLIESGYIPSYFSEIPGRLAALKQDTTPTTDIGKTEPIPFVAGGTDLYVQKGEVLPQGEIEYLQPEMAQPGIVEEGTLKLDARMSFEAFSKDAAVRESLPDFSATMDLIASWPIRARATLAGNLCNASPIGDMTSILLALDAKLLIGKSFENGTVPSVEDRQLLLNAFYLGYKQLNKAPDELVKAIWIPLHSNNEEFHFNWEKVSKRPWLDIASVNSGLKLCIRDGLIKQATLSMGGVAPIPATLPKAAAYLVGKPPEQAVLNESIAIALTEIAPISDVRGSADYKRLLTRQLMIAHFIKLFPEQFQWKEAAAYASL